MNMSEDLRLLESQLRQCFGRVVYSHKTHEKAADRLLAQQKRIRVWQIVISALVTGGIASSFVETVGTRANVVSALLSALLLILNAYTMENDMGQLAQRHRRTGVELWQVRESYLSVLTDIRCSTASADSVRATRDGLQEKLGAIYAGSPSTDSKAYADAQKALKWAEDMTFSEAEINAFLPNELKRESLGNEQDPSSSSFHGDPMDSRRLLEAKHAHQDSESDGKR